MRTLFYPKLALENIRKNARTYVPYILTCIFTVAMYYIMRSLSLNPGIKNILGAETVAYTMSLGCNVIAVFSCIFLFYTNSFLMKNRKKEFGLFNILGMEKKHIGIIIAWESLYVLIFSILLGLGTGMLLDKLMYLIIVRFLRGESAMGFYISDKSMLNTALLFSVIFLLIFLNSLRTVHLSKPVDLLKGGNTGEREPKAKWLLAILGLICIGIGYYIAITTKDPVAALLLFFLAVILVIIGTYLLFTASSIAFLKMLKKNRNYYYKTEHFISVSGMIYRMKQNAVGLASICILSTMVLVMVSSTTSLIIGTEDILHTRYPHQIGMYCYTDDSRVLANMEKTTDELAQRENITIDKRVSYTWLSISATYKGGDTFHVGSPEGMEDVATALNSIVSLFIVTQEDYAKAFGEIPDLGENEVLLWSSKTDYKDDHFLLFDTKYTIRDKVEHFVDEGLAMSYVYPAYGIVVKDGAALREMDAKQKEKYGRNASDISCYIGFDTTEDARGQEAFGELFRKAQDAQLGNADFSWRYEIRESQRTSLYSLYGGLFFLGIFLGLLFIMATVLIIYYKQISEGYEDKKRFAILQKVGMSEQEVKGSIRSQVLTVFFLPLVTAGVHTAAAFPIVKQILHMLMLTNTTLYCICTIGSFLVFGIIYGIIYLLTAKVYYKIVRQK